MPVWLTILIAWLAFNILFVGMLLFFARCDRIREARENSKPAEVVSIRKYA
jgi:hypothetical protein